MVVRCLSKVCDSYKLDKKTKRTFKSLGSIAYDSRILTYKNDSVSIWCIGGREKMPFVCHNQKFLPYIKGEADLIYIKGKFYLFQTCEVPEEDLHDSDEFIGVDFGCTDIIATSEGQTVSSKTINNYRIKREKIRSSIQRKGTKSSKKLLKRLSGKEKTTAKIINHTISKELVLQAKKLGKGIAIENLTHIRSRTEKKVRKKHRGLRSKWSYNQLREFITYKAKLNGVKLVVVNPAYTSKTCHSCMCIGKRNSKNFFCKTCGHYDADINAAKVISLVGLTVNQPEKASICSCKLHRA
jgi:IS605 OrfB family transposase